MGSALGAEKVAAGRVGLSHEAYVARLASGEKWCTRCKTFHGRAAFGVDVHRTDGLTSYCLASRRVTARRPRPRTGFRGWRVDGRDGDTLQARRRVNYLVEQGVIPKPNALPCVDCGHVYEAGGKRHEYDHFLGYDVEHHLDVEVVCTDCHHRREKERG